MKFENRKPDEREIMIKYHELKEKIAILRATKDDRDKDKYIKELELLEDEAKYLKKILAQKMLDNMDDKKKGSRV